MRIVAPALAALLLASSVAVGGSIPSSPAATTTTAPAPAATPAGEAPQRDAFGGAYTRKPLGIPAKDSVRFYPAVVAAASAKGLTAHDMGDEVLVTAGKDTIRYRKEGAGLELWITFKTKGRTDDELRVRNAELLALHQELLATATTVATTASAFSAPAAAAAAPPETAQLRCDNGTDCGFGTFCRDRGDGVKLCMGKGSTGDYCTNGTDCTFGTFCRKRGDGFEVCMGNGRRGDACAVGTDCGSGLFCRDGAPFKTCR